MAHSNPGECERCNDVGRYGVKAVALAIPKNHSWPRFNVCEKCADELVNEPFGGKTNTYYLIRVIEGGK